MRIVWIAAGRRQPDWVQAGYREYARRLSGACTLDLVEIALGRRLSADPTGSRRKSWSGRTNAGRCRR